MGINLRPLISLTPEEMAAYLEECRTVQVATINRDGTPHLAPNYYVLIDGLVTFWTYGASQKIRNLRRDPRIACLVETSTRSEDARGLQINGTAEIVESREAVLDVGMRLRQRYGGAIDNEATRAQVAKRGAKRVVVKVHPLRCISWDHGKLADAAARAPSD